MTDVHAALEEAQRDYNSALARHRGPDPTAALEGRSRAAVGLSDAPVVRLCGRLAAAPGAR